MNQKPFRTLMLWAIWAATAIIVYATLYRGTQVWEFVQTDPSKITWLIILLFAFGILGSFTLTILITLEATAAFRVEEAVKLGKGLTGLDPGQFRRAVGRFFSALKSTTEASGTVDVEALLNSELSVYQRISHSIEVVGNLLITLGLIGTVAGLTLTLTGLTGSLEALGHDQEMLLSGLRKAMSGMGTAFYTTLLGAVLGGVLLRVFAQITDHGVHGLFDKIMQVCLVHCTADLQPSLERDMRYLDKQVEILGRRVQALQSVFAASRAAMAEFRTEVQELRDNSRGENEALYETIRLHKHYCEMLREEHQLMRALNKPWWIRLRDAIWSPKS